MLAVLEATRSTWQVWHVRAEALRQARYAGVPLADLDETVRAVTERVTQQLSVPVTETPDLGEPEVLRRPDGESVYTVHGSRTYTSTGILDAERRLLEAAERTDGHTVQEIFVRLAIGRATENGTPLDPGQADLVARLATSGARVQVALAPAGSGKTTAMATLAKAWRAGGGDVVGLAPTAVAAAELGAAIDTPAETVAKFLHATSLAADDSRVAAFPPVGPRTLLVVDEAGMVGTKDLAAVVDHVLARGGSVRLVGDDQQLTAVAASGVFRDLAELGDRTGTTVRLTELHRFTDPAEATATLGIRDGDPDRARALPHPRPGPRRRRRHRRRPGLRRLARRHHRRTEQPPARRQPRRRPRPQRAGPRGPARRAAPDPGGPPRRRHPRQRRRPRRHPPQRPIPPHPQRRLGQER